MNGNALYRILSVCYCFHNAPYKIILFSRCFLKLSTTEQPIFQMPATTYTLTAAI